MDVDTQAFPSKSGIGPRNVTLLPQMLIATLVGTETMVPFPVIGNSLPVNIMGDIMGERKILDVFFSFLALRGWVEMETTSKPKRRAIFADTERMSFGVSSVLL